MEPRQINIMAMAVWSFLECIAAVTFYPGCLQQIRQVRQAL